MCMITLAIISLTNHFLHQVVINEKFLTVLIIVLPILLNMHVSFSFLHVYIVNKNLWHEVVDTVKNFWHIISFAT